MRDGAAKNRSVRIVADFVPGAGGGGSTAYQLYTTTFESVQSADGAQVYPSPGDTFVINGRPFTGTGFGFQFASFVGGNPIYAGATTNKLDAVDPTPYSSYLYPTQGGSATLSGTAPLYLWPYALLPNHAHFTAQNPNVAIQLGGGNYTDPGGPGVATGGAVLPGANAATGGANEPYDAVDYQNMHLAMHYYDTNVLPPTSMPANLVHPPVLTPEPSFHRSARCSPIGRNTFFPSRR